MMDEEKRMDEVERYLRGEMSAEKQEAFESAMAEDPELQQMVEEQRLEWEGMELLLEQDLRKEMDQWESSLPPDPPTSSGISRLWWIAFIPFFVGGIYWLSRPGGVAPKLEEQPPPPAQEAPAPHLPEESVSPSESSTPPVASEQDVPTAPSESKSPPPEKEMRLAELTREYYERPDYLDPQDFLTRSSESPNTPTALGIQALANGEQQKAIDFFQQVEEDGTAFYTAQEWLAHTYMKTGNYSKAADTFESLAATQTGIKMLKDQTEWYLLLSLLPDYEDNQARFDALLNEMTLEANAHTYAEPAQEIRSRINLLKR